MKMAKQKHYTKVKKSLVVLGLIGALFVGTFTLTGCSTSELKQAQQNIDTSVTAVLNSSDIQEVENGLFSGYTFLCADVEHAENSQYSIDINGIAKHIFQQRRVQKVMLQSSTPSLKLFKMKIINHTQLLT